MNDKIWHAVILSHTFSYGFFLVTQAFIDVWPTEQMHRKGLFIGGVVMLLWAVRFFVKKPAPLLLIMNGIGITAVIVFPLLFLRLVIKAIW